MLDALVPERGQRLGVVGAAMVAISSVVAWNGTDANLLVAPGRLQYVVLGLAFVAWVVVLFRPWSEIDQMSVAAIGAVTVGVTGERLVAFLGDPPVAGVPDPTPGLGLYLGVFGGVVLLVGGGLDYLEGR